MSRYGRDPDKIILDIAYAVGEGEDVLEALRRRHAVRWAVRAPSATAADQSDADAADTETHRPSTAPRDTIPQGDP